MTTGSQHIAMLSVLRMLKYRWWSSWANNYPHLPYKKGWGHSDQFSCHVTWIDCVPWVFKGPMVFLILLILDHKCCQSFWILDISRRSEVDITLSVFWKSWIELLSLPLPSIWRLKGRRFFLVPNQPATNQKEDWNSLGQFDNACCDEEYYQGLIPKMSSKYFDGCGTGGGGEKDKASIKGILSKKMLLFRVRHKEPL